MPRRPLDDRGVQTSLRLPRGLYDRLAEAAGDRGLGAEIRRRLEGSLSRVEVDWRTQKLADAVALVAMQTGWRNSRRGFAVFRAALGELLTHVQPPNEPAPDRTIERDAARAAGVAIGTTELGFGEEWGWELTDEEATRASHKRGEKK